MCETHTSVSTLSFHYKKTNLKNLLLLSVLLIAHFPSLFSQNDIDLNSLPDVVDYTVIRSNPAADTVIIGLHGGPTGMLYQGDFSFFENIPTFSVVEMQQFQHLNPEILTNSGMTLEEAIAYNDSTVALLRKTVSYFND